MKLSYILPSIILCAEIAVSCGKTLDYTSDKPSSGPASLTVNLAEAGMLESALFGEDKTSISELVISGPINGTDLIILREMAGADIYGNETKGSLERLDLKNARFVDGGDVFFIYVNSEDGKEEPIKTVEGCVPRYAFGYCKKLKNIILPDGTEHIESQAFYECKGLERAEIPESVESIGRSAFCECASLLEATIPECVTIIGDFLFYNCVSLQRVEAKGFILLIGYAAFGGCSSLKVLEGGFTNEMIAIDKYAYFGCKSLENAPFPKSATTVPYACYYDCSKITSFDFSNIEIIEDNAFCNSGLTSITLPEGVTSIGNLAFGATHVKIIVGHSDLSGELILPKSLTCLGYGAFYWSGLTKVTIQSNIEVSRDRISSSVGTVFNCPDLKQVVIAEGVEYLEVDFYSSQLTEVTLPSTLKRLGYWGLFSYDAYTFSNCKSLNSINLPEGIEIIGSGAFANCTSLQDIHIPTGIQSLGAYTFSGCSSLKTIDLSHCDNLDNISQGLFKDCIALESVNLPSSILSIGYESFNGCSALSSIALPLHIDNIGKEAFKGCAALKEIEIPKQVMRLEESTFAGCTSLEKILLPSQLEVIDNECFYQCTSLNNVQLPASLKNIGSYAFSHCASMNGIAIPDGVNSIHQNTFDNCRNLESVSLPSSIQSLEDNCFASCIHLGDLTIGSSIPPTVGQNAFHTTPISNVTLHVPSESLPAYSETSPWNDFGTILPIQ